MHSLAQEIQGFSKTRLKKQCTHVTTVTGRRLLERRSDVGDGAVEQVEELEEGDGCGFVEDKSLDLQVGVVRPFLLLGNIFHLLSLLLTLLGKGAEKLKEEVVIVALEYCTSTACEDDDMQTVVISFIFIERLQ